MICPFLLRSEVAPVWVKSAKLFQRIAWGCTSGLFSSNVGQYLSTDVINWANEHNEVEIVALTVPRGWKKSGMFVSFKSHRCLRKNASVAEKSKTIAKLLSKVYEGYVDLSFAESIQLTVIYLHSMLKNVHFCSGRRLHQFGVDQRFSSEKLPEGAFFAYFQVV